MSQSKTDKIRKRLEQFKERNENMAEALGTEPEKTIQHLSVNALEAVLEECEETLDNISYPVGQGAKASKILDIIADELDVEEG